MPVEPFGWTYSEDTPAPDAVWEMTTFFRHNWEQPVVVRSAFSTSVESAKTDSEHRRGLLGRPFRTITASLRTYSSSESRRLWDDTFRRGISRHLFPLYSDQTVTTDVASGTSIPCSTVNRRFFVGANVVVVAPGPITSPPDISISRITAVAAGSITVDGALWRSFPKGSLVLPLIASRLNISQDLAVKADTILEAPVEAIELPSQYSLDAMTVPGSMPLDFPQYAGYPIFDVLPNFSSDPKLSIVRTGSHEAAGLTQSTTVYGDQPRVEGSFPTLHANRAAAMRIVRFFESRGGRLHPFWVPSTLTGFTSVAYLPSGIKVPSVGPAQNWAYRSFLAQISPGGVVAIRKVLSVSSDGAEDTVVLDSAFPSTDASCRIVDAALARFSSDELVEQWHTDEVCDMDISTISLLEEEAREILNVRDPATQPISAKFLPTSGASSASIGDVQMYFHPCRVRGPRRPLVRAADLALPSRIDVTFASGGWSKDTSFPLQSGSISNQAISALAGTWECTPVGPPTTETSRHWHHMQLRHTSPSFTPYWGHSGDISVTRHTYRSSKTYTGADSASHTITVEVHCEFSSGTTGGKGTFTHIYAFCDEVNKDYAENAVFGPRHNLRFTKSNPAVWGGIVDSSHNSEKYLHPQTLVHASVPTSMESPCDSYPWLCDDNFYAYGFSETCESVPSPIPWVEGSGAAPLGNAEYVSFFPPQVDISPYWRAATSLGGDCPNSRLIPFAFVENGANSASHGISALIASADGISKGKLDVLSGSLVTVSFCDADQLDNRISCCDGHPSDPYVVGGSSPECWKAPAESPDSCEGTSDKCCFAHDSAIELTVVQRCFCETIRKGPFNGFDCDPGPDCSSSPPVYNYSVCGQKTRTWVLPVCEADYSLSSGENRYIKWQLYVPASSQEQLTWGDDFDTKQPLTWSTLGPSWTVVDPGGSGNPCILVTGGGSGTVPQLYIATDPYSGASFTVSHVNGTVSATVKTSKQAGVAARMSGASAPLGGYIAVASAEGRWLKVYFLDSNDGTKTLIASKTSLPAWDAPYRLSLSVRGDSISAVVDGVAGGSVAVSHCGRQNAGFFGLCGLGDEASFDDFSVTVEPRLHPIWVSYDGQGWRISVDEDILGPPWPGCTSDNNGCGFLGSNGEMKCNCTSVVRGYFPDVIDFSSSSPSSFGACLPGDPKPYAGDGGPGINATVGQCVSSGWHTPTADWVVCSIRAANSCAPSCPEGIKSTCSGLDLWGGHGFYVAAP